jgi:hypothetical protein
MIQINQEVSWRSSEYSVQKAGIVRAVVNAGEDPLQLLNSLYNPYKSNYRKFNLKKSSQQRFLIEVTRTNRRSDNPVSYWYCCRVSSITAQNRSNKTNDKK